MANICDNTFYAVSDDENNLTYIAKFLEHTFDCVQINEEDFTVEANFYSKWVYPINEMEALFDGLPNKKDIYMRCLSVEYGCDYVAYHTCTNDEGWIIH